MQTLYLLELAREVNCNFPVNEYGENVKNNDRIFKNFLLNTLLSSSSMYL